MNPHQPVISLRNARASRPCPMWRLLTKAETEGSPAYLAYTPDGNNCFVAGESDFVRCFHISDQGEPQRVDLTSLGIFSVAASGVRSCAMSFEDSADSKFQNSHFIVGGETGAVCRHSIEDKLLERIIVRHTSAVRDVAVSPDGDWCASTGESVHGEYWVHRELILLGRTLSKSPMSMMLQGRFGIFVTTAIDV